MTSYDESFQAAVRLIRTAAGRTITYRRPPAAPGENEQTVELLAVLARDTSELDDHGFTTRRREYLVLAEELILAGQPATPRRGDRISDGPETWEVVDHQATPAANPADPAAYELLIQTIKCQA